MGTRTVDFGGNTRSQPVPTGAFGAQDTILLSFKVPENATRVFLLMAQVLSDANLTLTFNGKRKSGLQSCSINSLGLKPGDYTAVLTADAGVHDVNAHLTIQVERPGR